MNSALLLVVHQAQKYRKKHLHLQKDCLLNYIAVSIVKSRLPL